MAPGQIDDEFPLLGSVKNSGRTVIVATSKSGECFTTIPPLGHPLSSFPKRILGNFLEGELYSMVTDFLIMLSIFNTAHFVCC